MIWRKIGQATRSWTMPDGILTPIEVLDSSHQIKMSKTPWAKLIFWLIVENVLNDFWNVKCLTTALCVCIASRIWKSAFMYPIQQRIVLFSWTQSSTRYFDSNVNWPGHPKLNYARRDSDTNWGFRLLASYQNI